MENIARTCYGSEVQTAMFLGLPYTVAPFSTLNQRFSIEADAVIPAGVYPRARYLVVGQGGHEQTQGADGIGLTTEVQHQSTDAAPYKPMPLVLRATNDDLTPTERARYALRRTETHTGVSYFAYYAKRINMSGVTVERKLIVTNTDGTETSVTFVPDNTNLYPVKPDLSNAGINVLAAKRVVVSAVLPVEFTAADCAELINVAKVMRGDEAYALFSELALCTGVDKVIQLSDSTNFTEVIGCQIASFIATMHIVRFSSTGINGTINVGANEPLLVLE